MGNKESATTRPQLPELLWCSVCYDWLAVKDIRALQCGHYFCMTCLEEWARQELIECPKCRQADTRGFEWLDDLHTFSGKFFLEDPPDMDDALVISNLLHMQMVRRSRTAKYLRVAADEVAQVEITGAGVKIGGSVAGLVGTGMLITGAALSLTGVGAVVGVPLAISGGAVGGVGGLTVGGGILGESISKNKKLEVVNEHLQSDYFHSMQIRILVGKASTNECYAGQIGLKVHDALSMLTLLGRATKFGFAVSPAARAAAIGAGRGALTAGAHITGIAIAAVLVPIDIAQIVISSIKIHKKDKSAVVKEMEQLADELEKELWKLLHDKEYSLLELECLDDQQIMHWLLVAVDPNDSQSSIDALNNISLHDIEKSHIIMHDSVGSPVEDEVYSKVYGIWFGDETEEKDGDSVLS